MEAQLEQLNPLSRLAPMLRTLGMVAIGIGGCLLFGMIGSMTYPGVGAIAGSLVGFALFLVIGFLVMGKYKDIVRGGGDIFDLPDMISEHPSFTLFLTIHRVTSVEDEKMCGIGFGKQDAFVQVKCGINPIKSTCVKEDGKWNETFRLNIRSKDKSIVLQLMDQNVFGDGKIGQVTLDIDDDLIDRAFPQECEFKVEGDAQSIKGAPKAVLILSFDHGPDFPETRIAHLRNQFPQEFEKRARRTQNAMTEWSKLPTYGTLAPQLNFQTQRKSTEVMDSVLQTKV
eukprot:GEMP01009559.1.p1 GENE.GEMP01009559.1~~GEMP01009559.1.p1  ORF type:complete len:284 (+),score=60.35 GEMP01009559.1:2130-2981(+)